jgi:hypothetical protein
LSGGQLGDGFVVGLRSCGIVAGHLLLGEQRVDPFGLRVGLVAGVVRLLLLFVELSLLAVELRTEVVGPREIVAALV